MQVYTYKIPIDSLFIPQKIREGLIIETAQGWGEVAPLPSFSRETLKKAYHSLRGNFSSPSSYFGYQTALLPFPKSFPPIIISRLISNFPDAIQAINQGFKNLKIKAKNLSIDQTIELVTQIEKFRDIHLRIDANRKWTLKDAQRFFRSIPSRAIEYVEEPVENPFDLCQLTELPIAFDETLLENFAPFLHLPNLSAFVLKPTLLGQKLDEIVNIGQKLKKKLVFSSCFESAIGLLHIAHLQKKIAPEIAAGIDTHRFFQNNFLPFPMEGQMLSNNPLPPLDRRWLIDSAP